MSGFDEARLEELPDKYSSKVETFIAKKKNRGKANSSVQNYKNRATYFLEWLEDNYGALPLEEVTTDIADEYSSHVRDNYGKEGLRGRVLTVRDFFEILGLHVGDRDAGTHKPWDDPVANLPDTQEAREPSDAFAAYDTRDIGAGLRQITHPLWHALCLAIFKLLVRPQEGANILLSEIHIQDPDVQQLYNELGIDLHKRVRNRPDTIYVPSDREGNKRKHFSLIPIDSELKAALIRWLAARPPVLPETEDPHLFVSLTTNYGESLTPSSINDRWNTHRPEEWEKDGLTPNDARHFGVRKFRRDMHDSTLRFLRGDSPDTLDEYDNLVAEFDSLVRPVYLKSVPRFYI